MLARELSDWPDGVVPVWTVLGAKGLATLKREPSPENRALRLATDLGEEGLTECAFVRNALVLMRATVEGPDALRLTANGTLSLASVAAMRGAMAWPDMEATEHFREGTKYRERDVWELHLLRRLVETAGLIGRGGLWFELTPLGGTMLDPGNRGALHALLFRNLFWHTDLSLIVGGLVRRVPGRWPQGEIGVILWSLASVAEEWQSTDMLTALCAGSGNTITEEYRSTATWLFSARVLWTLRWFGLMEWRERQEMFDVGRWRKTALFDRFLSFDVPLADSRPAGH